MKSKFIYLICLALMPAAALVGCMKDSAGNTPVDQDQVAAQFVAGIAGTRAHDGVWDEGDAIGLAMLLDGTEVINNVYNFHYIRATGSEVFEPSNPSQTIYFPQDGTEVNFRAYYPFYPSLANNMLIPVDVANQTVLPDIDLMTAEHLAGASKANPVVHLTFHHRLSKLIFKFDGEDNDQFADLSAINVTARGMYTKGEYDLLTETLIPEGGTIDDITIPMHDQEEERYGIVLPRAASSGVSFEFSAPNGNSFIADMSDTLNLVGGYQYTFHINLKETPVLITADIQPWDDGPESYYDALQVNTSAGPSTGVTAGDRMNVYLYDGTDYGYLTTFTYTAGGRWDPSDPVYWEEIEQDPAHLRASIVAEPALNTSQLADILISDEISVAHNTGARFTFNHAASKATVTLTSDIYTAADLESATIVFPNYLRGGVERNGTFVPGTARGTVTADRSDSDNAIALFQPQGVAPGDPILRITVNGRTYDAEAPADGFSFAAGTAYRFNVSIRESGINVSAVIVDWIDMDPVDLEAVTMGRVAIASEGAVQGDVMTVYTGNESSRTELTRFIYTNGDWVPDPAVYWENLPALANFYASIPRTAKYNDTQLDQILVAAPQLVSMNNGVDFTLSYPQAKVVVQLSSSDSTYTAGQLSAMQLVLPEYASGAVVNNGVFVPGTDVDDIVVRKGVGTNGSAVAIIQPQSIAAGAPVVQITDPGNGRTYDATYQYNITYRAGYATILNIDMARTGLTVSATIVDWQDGEQVSLVVDAIQIGGELGNTSDDFIDKAIRVYKLGTTTDTHVYSYLQTGSGYRWRGDTPLYWNDEILPLTLAAVFFPSETNVATVDASARTFAWDLPGDQTDGYQQYDIVMDKVTLTTPGYVNFVFSHVLSKVRVELVPGIGFEAAELKGARVTLNNFRINGTADLGSASMINIGAATDLAPHTDTDGRYYSALVQPQTVVQGTQVLTLELAGSNTAFPGLLDRTLEFQPGLSHLITVTLNKTGITLSATLEGWDEGPSGGVIIQ